MVAVITIDTRKVNFMLSGYQRTIPKAGIEGIKEAAKFSALTYLLQAKQAGITSWRGKFFGTLRRQASRPTRFGKNSYGVSLAATNRGGINDATCKAALGFSDHVLGWNSTLSFPLLCAWS